MSPDYRDAFAAAKRVMAANERGVTPDLEDGITMSSYQLSLHLRLLPPRARFERAQKVTRAILANVRESLA